MSKERPALPGVVFELTSRCNLNCRYCYNHWKRPEDTTAPFGSYKEARRTLKALFKRVDVDHISFSGGEPFLAERFAELVLLCRMKHKRVAIITNGNQATVDDYQTMVSLGVAPFELPLHSDRPDEHDAMTGKRGSWQRSLDSIRSLLKLDANVVVVIVATAINTPRIEATLRHIVDMGVTRIMLNRFNIGGRGIAEQERLRLDIPAIKEMFARANATISELGVRVTSNVSTPWCVIHPRDYPNIGFTTCSVELSNRPVTINSRGDIRVCNHSPEVFGNIHQDDLSVILDSAHCMAQWSGTTPKECMGCEEYLSCRGGCRAASMQLGFGLERPDPILS